MSCGTGVCETGESGTVNPPVDIVGTVAVDGDNEAVEGCKLLDKRPSPFKHTQKMILSFVNSF